MTATLALPPVLAAAVVNGLVGVAVLDAVPCPYERCNNGALDAGRPVIGHHDCGGSGTVAPSVEPGQRLAIAATREDPGDGGAGPWHWGNCFLTHDDHLGAGYGLHTGKVVGSAVAASTALPIVGPTPAEYHAATPPFLQFHPKWPSLWLRMPPGMGNDEELTAALPWLPSDLVGRWAVLVEDAATTEQRCPTCWGYNPTPTSRPPCPTCDDRDLCPPVPLPDGFDPEPYTLTELEMTT